MRPSPTQVRLASCWTRQGLGVLAIGARKRDKAAEGKLAVGATMKKVAIGAFIALVVLASSTAASRSRQLLQLGPVRELVPAQRQPRCQILRDAFLLESPYVTAEDTAEAARLARQQAAAEADRAAAKDIAAIRRQNRSDSSVVDMRGLKDSLRSPSIDLDPWVRAAFERQISILEARRVRAEQALQKQDAVADAIHAEARDSDRALGELSEDTVSDILDVVQGVVAVSGAEIPPVAQQVDALLGLSKFTADTNWALRAPAGSSRPRSKAALDAVVSLSGALTFPRRRGSIRRPGMPCAMPSATWAC